MLGAADKVGPLERRLMVEPEAPVRRHAIGHRRALGPALIDRREAAREQELAPDLQLLGRFVPGIEAPRRLQFFELGLVKRKARRLPPLAAAVDTHPRAWKKAQVGTDGYEQLR